jgi:UDP-glucose 4-epimerase
MKICVTGGAGYIGSHLVSSLLSKGHEVIVIDDLSNGEFFGAVHPNHRYFSHDIREIHYLTNVLKDTEVFFHLAADKRAAAEDYYDISSVNIAGTTAVLEAARKVNARRFVFSSSCAVYTKNMYSKGKVSEEDANQEVGTQQGMYGLSKLLGEDICKFMSKGGMTTVALRYFNVWGGRYLKAPKLHKSAMEIFLDRKHDNSPIKINGDGTTTRDFVHIDDVVDSNLLAMDHNVDGEIETFNICTGVGTKIIDIAKMIAGEDHPITYGPISDVELPWCIGSYELAKNRLGWEPKHKIEEVKDLYNNWLRSKDMSKAI